MVETLVNKLIGRNIDVTYCDRCGIFNGMFPIQITITKYICPRCGLAMTKVISIKLQSKN
jgi:predicted RNA-binding Zn-ribbon protein involved in translation (DUF1610 family)